MQDADGRLSRRDIVKAGAALLALPTLGSLLAGTVSGCGSGEPSPAPPAPEPAAKPDSKPVAPAPKPAAPQPQAPPAPAAGSAGDLVTEIPAMAALVGGLQYVPKSAKPDESCRNCQFFSAEQGGLGKCQLFSEGRVAAVGWCSSWTKRVATT